MQIQFDINGNLIPSKIFLITPSLLRENFASTLGGEKREELFRNYTRYTDDLNSILFAGFSQWIGGSFISIKSEPNDIDIVNLINFDDTTELLIEKLLPFFLIGGSKSNLCRK